MSDQPTSRNEEQEPSPEEPQVQQGEAPEPDDDIARNPPDQGLKDLKGA